MLMAAGMQIVHAQGFRVYKSDGMVAQYSVHADSIVFYDGLGSDMNFGPYTPVNQMIEGTWYISATETVTFNKNGTTDYMEDATYKFFPYQGNIVIYNSSGAPANILNVYDLSADKMVLSTSGKNIFTMSRKSLSLCPDNHHPHAIDLGLPSGTKWCCCNVGAANPKDYGGYYAWGETHEKSEYSWETYAYYESGYFSTCTDIGSDIAGTQYDVAHASMGGSWRMPTNTQRSEFFGKCNHSETELDGKKGLLIVGPNGSQIFLPAAGFRRNNELYRDVILY